MKFIVCIIFSMSAFSHCILNRAGLDIGSGATKLKIAKVDVCKNKVLKVIFDESYPVEYKSDLKKSKDNMFSKQIIQKGEKVFHKISKVLREYNVEETRAVATSAFRTSKNSMKILNKAKKYNISVKVITQKEEALLGYKAARLLSRSNNYIVWDIGGGSMQMVYKENTSLDIYEGHLASVPFREFILKNVQKSKKQSPNPLSESDVATSVDYARKYALRDVSSSFKKLYAKRSIDVIGIGGVHSKAILKAMNRDKFYTKNQLEKFLNKQRILTDEQIGGKYASTSLSNLALVLGFMKGLSINKVISGNINLSDGLLFN